MLAFDVYVHGRHLEKWPETVHDLSWCLYTADSAGRPMERAYDTDLGRLSCYCPEGELRRLFIRWPVEGFGDPVLRTRLLKSGPFLYNLLLELALGRIELMDEERRKKEAEGIVFPSGILQDLRAAVLLAEKAELLEQEGNHASAALIAEESLAISLPAGEKLALAAAHAGLAHRIEHEEMSGFKFGCTGAGNLGEQQRRERFLELFNYATLPFYLHGMEPERDTVHHEPVLKMAHELARHNFSLKGHPLVWTFTMCVPPHHRCLTFDQCCDVFRKRIERDVPPFKGLITAWDIINEAHDTPWANSFGFTSAQMVELTVMAGKATRAAAGNKAKLVVNICLPFGEYVAGAPGRQTPLEYLKACIDAGVDFDTIGIQLYFGGGLYQYCWDMLEISRLLDEYVKLGKEIHITELGTPSANGPDANAMIKEGNQVGFWHGSWSEETQADWVEQFYTVCMSKPRLSAITWWSFSDASSVFWPHGGLLRQDDSPKLSFERLLKLKRQIGLGV